MSPRDDYDDFFGDDEGDDTPVVDTRADGRLYRLPLARLSPNLVNPRTDFGTEDELLDFGKSLARRQNQPCPAVSRSAYLKLWPDHGDLIGDIDYVLVSGERRYRAATAVGMKTIDCVINDDFAASRKVFMEAVVSENIDRRNFDSIEEANAVAAMAAEFGSNRAVAQHFERADSWVTMRIDLTYLCAEIQAMVRKKDIPLEDARNLGKLVKQGHIATASESQLDWWSSRQVEKAAKAAARQAEQTAKKAAARQVGDGPAEIAATPQSQSFTAVKPAVPATKVHPEAASPTKPLAPGAEPPPFGDEQHSEDVGDAGSAEGVPGPRLTAEDSSGHGHQEEPATAGTGQADRGEAASPAPPESPQVPEVLARPKMPWHDGAAVADLVTTKMPVEQQYVLFQRLQMLLEETPVS